MQVLLPFFMVGDREINMSRIPKPAVPIKPSARKAAVRGQLERLGLKVSDGHEYRLEDALLPDITSAQAVKR